MHGIPSAYRRMSRRMHAVCALGDRLNGTSVQSAVVVRADSPTRRHTHKTSPLKHVYQHDEAKSRSDAVLHCVLCGPHS